MMDVRLKCPFTLLLSGPSSCGKTTFVCDLLESGLFDTDIRDIIVCYSEWQPLYDKLKLLGCRFVEGLINPDELDPRQPHLVILDDLMDTKGDHRIEQFFTRTSHHRNCCVIYIVQNLFSQGPTHRTCSLNAHYICLFPSPRDVTQIRTLEQQMFPGKKRFLVDSYFDACQKPYHHLFIDLKADTPSHLRVRGNILNPHGQAVYLPKDFKWSPSTD